MSMHFVYLKLQPFQLQHHKIRAGYLYFLLLEIPVGTVQFAEQVPAVALVPAAVEQVPAVALVPAAVALVSAVVALVPAAVGQGHPVAAAEVVNTLKKHITQSEKS